LLPHLLHLLCDSRVLFHCTLLPLGLHRALKVLVAP
jgi:hypothetical protein